jgi:hypothetical protein
MSFSQKRVFFVSKPAGKRFARLVEVARFCVFQFIPLHLVLQGEINTVIPWVRGCFDVPAASSRPVVAPGDSSSIIVRRAGG